MKKCKNPFALAVINRIKDQIRVSYEPISNASILARFKSEGWDILGARFETKVVEAFFHKHTMIYHTLKPEMSQQQYLQNHFYEYIYKSFLSAIQITPSIKLSFSIASPEGKVQTSIKFVVYKPLEMEFKIQKAEDNGLDIIPEFKYNGDEISDVIQVFEFFLITNQHIYIIDWRHYNVLKKIEQKNWKQFRTMPDLLSKYVLVDIEKSHKVDRGTHFGYEEIRSKPIPQILLRESSGFLIMYPQWLYEGILVEGRYTSIHTVYKQGVKYDIYRDQEQEQWLIDLILQFHSDFANQLNGYFFISIDNAKKKNWFLKFYHSLLKAGIEFVGMDMLTNFRYSPHIIETKLDIINDLEQTIEVEIKVSFGDMSIDLQTLKKTLLARQRHIILKDNTLGILHDQWLEKYSLVIKHANIKGSIAQIPRWILLFQKNAFDDTPNLEDIIPEKWWRQWHQYQSSSDVVIPLDPKVHATLRPYQQKGYEWMMLLSKLGAGALLADDMGLGKTLQTICLLAAKTTESPNQKHLIISPASLMYNWKYEIEKFAPSLKAEVYHSQNRNMDEIGIRNPDILITSYATCRNDIDILNPIIWNTIVLDESHNIKNYQAQITQAVLTLKGNMRVLLSGTPVMNQTLDYYPQFSFMVPHLFGTKDFFAREYAQPIDKDQDAEKKEALKRITAPFILRRTKEQVATDLPEKVESIIWCEMGPEQRKLYSEINQNIKNSLFLDIQNQGLEKAKLNVIQGIHKLRQVCSSPALLSGYESVTSESIKIDIIMQEITENLRENKIIIFSQYLDVLDILGERLKSANTPYYCIQGSTPSIERQLQIEAFQNPNDHTRIFLLSLKAGNAGITLTQANYVFLIDPWWNRQVENQAIDRAYRIGQDKNVFAYRLLCRDTIEERILTLQERKLKLAEDLVIDDETFVKHITEEDLAYLFD